MFLNFFTWLCQVTPFPTTFENKLFGEREICKCHYIANSLRFLWKVTKLQALSSNALLLSPNRNNHSPVIHNAKTKLSCRWRNWLNKRQNGKAETITDTRGWPALWKLWDTSHSHKFSSLPHLQNCEVTKFTINLTESFVRKSKSESSQMQKFSLFTKKAELYRTCTKANCQYCKFETISWLQL